MGLLLHLIRRRRPFPSPVRATLAFTSHPIHPLHLPVHSGIPNVSTTPPLVSPQASGFW
ncbi:hypothetical protein PAXRUDRAFT_829040 [Paxillus rubicundulus Ve08.2h10]|uniref:Uncharacterized protein n=1 Tax=Paxillus rubicundulus Ve08.2h10 TaxID=930991 RepID=A0A0D0DNF2_9AGAM|nr:hypothetical protein PAXRUDRAFT_829040 [Paxillus rubicundulus Ve08.2h10]